MLSLLVFIILLDYFCDLWYPNSNIVAYLGSLRLVYDGQLGGLELSHLKKSSLGSLNP